MEQGGTVLERISPTATWLTGVSERAAASEPRERSAPAKRRARERVGESEGRRPSDKTRISSSPKKPLRLPALLRLRRRLLSAVALTTAATLCSGCGGSPTAPPPPPLTMICPAAVRTQASLGQTTVTIVYPAPAGARR